MLEKYEEVEIRCVDALIHETRSAQMRSRVRMYFETKRNKVRVCARHAKERDETERNGTERKGKERNGTEETRHEVVGGGLRPVRYETKRSTSARLLFGSRGLVGVYRKIRSRVATLGALGSR